MDAFNDPDVTRIVLKKSAQVGATECINNIVGYLMDQDPGPMLVVQPTLDIAKAWSKDRFAPMLRDTPCLQDRVAERRSRDSDNTILHKIFPGGHITIAGANSPASLASRPIRVVLLDEVDRYPKSAGTEGDPRKLAIKRSNNFWNRKVIEVSTPTIEGESHIDDSYEASDKCEFVVPCPHCGEVQRLMWAGIKWEKVEGEHHPETAYYECEHCHKPIEEKHRPAMMAEISYRATAPFHGVRGFHISELYSPWVRWSELVASFLEAKPLPETLQVWINTSLGETWREKHERHDPDDLIARAEDYNQPPEDVLCLTAAVDVQDDRLECSVSGWAHAWEQWVIQHRVWYGDPGLGELWRRLDDYLQSTFEREDGVTLRIAATTVDSGGHYTDEVYKFCKKRFARRVYAIKGVGGVGRPLVARPSTANRQKVRLYSVGVDTAKDMLFPRLAIDTPGPGYIHFTSALDDEFFHQVTAEERCEKYVQGQKTHYYKQVRARNEGLDLLVYNMAAVELLNPNFDAIAKRAAAPPAKKKSQPANPLMARPKKRKGFVRNWRR